MSQTLSSNPKKNPSRKTCEEIIRRILTTEASQSSTNRHFKHASDFIRYFESLYPSSPSLTKQVQRAVQSMQLAKDANGYFMIDRTREDYAAEQEIAHLFSGIRPKLLKQAAPIFLEIPPGKRQYFLHLIHTNHNLRELFTTAMETYNGVIIYSETPEEFVNYLFPNENDAEPSEKHTNEGSNQALDKHTNESSESF